MIAIAINGFGRIGKSFFRSVMQDEKALAVINIVAINVGPQDPSALPYMIRYDSIFGTWDVECTYHDGVLTCNEKSIRVFAESDPLNLPWQSLNIDWVVDVSGKFTRADDARKHIKSGAKKVLISAPAHDEDVSIVLGVNDDVYDASRHNIVSLGSCTTNALLPILKIIHEGFGIKNAMVSTTHAYTNSQQLLDVNAQMKDPRKSRAAALNIIPTSTGAQSMVGKIIPELATRVSAIALRVPVANVSLIDVTAVVDRTTTQDELLQHCIQAARSMKDIVSVTQEKLVSADFVGNSHSVVIDASLTAMQGQLIKVMGWYDNEWGYACRLKDFLMK